MLIDNPEHRKRFESIRARAMASCRKQPVHGGGDGKQYALYGDTQKALSRAGTSEHQSGVIAAQCGKQPTCPARPGAKQRKESLWD